MIQLLMVPFLLYYQLFNDTAFAGTERSLIAYRTKVQLPP